MALGATVIEKHFTLDRSPPGTDHMLSSSPPEFEQLVNDIRTSETLLGSPRSVPCRPKSIRDFVRGRFPK